MEKYHKIQSVFKRNPETNFKTFLDEFSLPVFDYLKDNIWEFTEKVDGTNIRIMWNGKEITIKGKTDKAELPKPLLEKLNKKKNNLKEKFIKMFGIDKNVCLYGEGYGVKIQTGGKYRQDQDVVIFDIKINNIWIKRKDVENICENLNFEIVPIIGYGNLRNMIDIVKEGFKSKWGDFIAEGIVARPLIELRSQTGRVITKLKYKDFQKG